MSALAVCGSAVNSSGGHLLGGGLLCALVGNAIAAERGPFCHCQRQQRKLLCTRGYERRHVQLCTRPDSGVGDGGGMEWAGMPSIERLGDDIVNGNRSRGAWIGWQWRSAGSVTSDDTRRGRTLDASHGPGLGCLRRWPRLWRAPLPTVRHRRRGIAGGAALPQHSSRFRCSLTSLPTPSSSSSTAAPVRKSADHAISCASRAK